MSENHEGYLAENTILFAKNFAQSIEDMMGCEFVVSEDTYKEEPFTPLYGMIASIHFAGQIQGDYVVVLEEKTAASIIEAYEEGMELEDLKEMREDYAGFIKECLNLSVGETIPSLEESFGELTFSPPVVIYGEIEYPEVINGIYHLSNEEKGSIQCGFSLNMANNKIGQRLEESLQELAQKTAEAKEARNNIETMLQLLPNGLISIDKAGTVLPGYSAATKSITGFNKDELVGEHITSVLLVDDKYVNDVNSWIELVFDKYDLLPFKDMVDLCPINEFNNGVDKILNVTWFPVENSDKYVERLFLVVQDVTEQRKLEAQAAELKAKHEENLELISQVVNLEPDEVTNFVYDSSNLIEKARNVVEGDAHDRKFITELFRTFHTLKSSSGQYNFKGLQKLAHQIESHLKAVDESGEDTLSDDVVEDLKHGITDAADYIDRLEQLQIKLGGKDETIEAKASRQEPTIMIPIKSVNTIEERIDNLNKIIFDKVDSDIIDQVDKIKNSVKELRMISLGFFKSSLESLAKNTAEKLNKKVKLTIKDGPSVDISKMRIIHKVLVHMVNNSVDHGIEDSDIRKSIGKLEDGVIVISSKRDGNNVTITIEDDGQGIDDARVREALITKHGFDQEVVRAMDKSEVYKHLFIPGFSTKDEVTVVSGRGIGMDYVYDSVVEKLKGSINVESEAGKGTKVIIEFED